MQQQQYPQEREGGKPRVFVYGTLKQGEANHRLITNGNGRFLGPATVVGNYAMRDLGWYPGVVRLGAGHSGTIHGEVYEVDNELLATLDILEGHPTYYQRSKVSTSHEEYGNVWIYTLPEGYMRSGEPVHSGNWESGNGAG
jgi:gamma-glutamylaminecyclotransferase